MLRNLNPLPFPLIALIAVLPACRAPETPTPDTPEFQIEVPAPTAQYVRVTDDVANILLDSTLTATVIAEARAGDVFKLHDASDEWYEVSMFAGDWRYLHYSVADTTTTLPPLPPSPDVRKRACDEIISAQGRAIDDAIEKYPTDFSRQIDYERLLYDRYELPIFQKYAIPPAQNSPLVLECAKNL